MNCPLCDGEIVAMYGRHELRRLADHLIDMHTSSLIGGGFLHLNTSGDALRCWCGWSKVLRPNDAYGGLRQLFAEHLAANGGLAHVLNLMLGIDRP